MICHLIKHFVRLGRHRALGLVHMVSRSHPVDFAIAALYPPEGAQDDLWRQRNFRDDRPKRPERVIDRVGYGRRRTGRAGLACTFAPNSDSKVGDTTCPTSMSGISHDIGTR